MKYYLVSLFMLGIIATGVMFYYFFELLKIIGG